MRGQPERQAAFDAATRHSRRVSRLKRLFFGGSCAVALGLAFFTLPNPLSRIPPGVSAAGAALSGSKITMRSPKLNGFRRDGRPYQLLASSGVQDVGNPTLVELEDIDASLTLTDQSVLKLRATHGIYDSTHDKMKVTKDLQVIDSSHYRARMQSADLDFRTGSIVSSQPVTVVTETSTIAADAIDISNNGDEIVFTGDVRSVVFRTDGAAQ